MHYDASKAPDPKEWLELDESDRIDAVIAYHKRAKKQVGQDKRMHAMAHVIVESQAAMGDATAVPAALDRLMREGPLRASSWASFLMRSRAPKVRRSTSTRIWP